MPARRLETQACLLAVLALCAALPLHAGPVIHKCQVNGATVYQQVPCPPDEARRQPTAAELNAERKRRLAQAASEAASANSPPRIPLPKSSSAAPTAPARATTPAYRCDGRKHCSQMRSCEEAHHFLRHCPGVEMDGDGDGIPCERQWCGG